jgi:glycosyltransferase involved in cell wall biosynthesis
MDNSNGNPKVSICIPAYNASNFIVRTIQSILESSYKDVEIIISDDASQDNTCEIINHFNDPRIKLFQNSKTLGPVRNWNCALQKASGEYLGLLNHDDLFGPFWLTFVVHILEKYSQIGWVTTSFRRVDENERTLSIVSAFPETREYLPIEVFPVVARLDGLGPGFIARRNVLEAVEYFDEHAGPGADNDLFLRLAWRFPMYYSNYPHTAWRSHDDNLTDRWNFIDQAQECTRSLDNVFSDSSLPAEFQAFREYAYNYLCTKILEGKLYFLKKGDFESACALAEILSQIGYKYDLPFPIRLNGEK